MPTKNTRAPISKVQRLKDQGANGSPAYEFSTKIARAKDKMSIEKLAADDHWKKIVAHVWSSSYLLRDSGAHYRLALRMRSKGIPRTSSNWTGQNVWGSPVVALAPPLNPLKYGTPRRYFIGDAGWNPT